MGVVSLLSSVRARYDQLAREAGKFGVVGVLSTLIDIGAFNILLAMTDKPVTSRIIAGAIASLNAFILNRAWTFRHRERAGSLGRESMVFLVLNIIGLGISTLPLAVSTYVLGFEGPLAANIATYGFGLPLGTLFRFVCYRRFVWVEPKVVEVADADGDPAAHAVLTDARPQTAAALKPPDDSPEPGHSRTHRDAEPRLESELRP